jgi:hypothetical protein
LRWNVRAEVNITTDTLRGNGQISELAKATVLQAVISAKKNHAPGHAEREALPNSATVARKQRKSVENQLILSGDIELSCGSGTPAQQDVLKNREKLRR